MYPDFSALIGAFADPIVPVRAVIVGGEDFTMLSAAVSAQAEGWLSPILLGDASRLRASLAMLSHPTHDITILESTAPAGLAAQMCAEGEADFLVQGSLSVSRILEPFLCQGSPLYAGACFSQFFLTQLPSYHKLLALCIPAVDFPTQPKLDGILTAVETMHTLGWSQPKTAILCQQDELDPKLPETFVASELGRMCLNEEIRGAILRGPVTYEAAMSRTVARETQWYPYTRGWPVAPPPTASPPEPECFVFADCGDFDLLVAPSKSSGYILSGCWMSSLNATVIHLAVGGPTPAVLRPRSGGSRSAKLALHLAALLAERSHACASI